MAASTGYSSIATNGLVFAYDTADSFNSYKGEPTTNYWNGNQFSIYNDGATNVRNSTDVAPPVPGYEVVKVTANNIGTYGQCILWNSTFPNNNVATITNSIYAYLTVGDYVQVGQHWWPWYYGTQKSIAKNQWVRISETYTINEGNSYGNAALTYSTNGIAYFAMPQYEYKSHVTPFIGANQTRSNTQGLLDISGGNNTITLTNMTYDANALPTFDGTDDYINIPHNSAIAPSTGYISVEAIFKAASAGSENGSIIYNKENEYEMSAGGGYISYAFRPNWAWVGSTAFNTNQWYHTMLTYDQSYQRLYVNGVQVYSAALSGAIGNVYSEALRIGARGGNGAAYGFFNGQIPVVKIYNRALSAGEVKQNYNFYKTRFSLP